MSGKVNSAVEMASVLGATVLARKVVDTTWKVGAKGKPAPNDPTDPDARLREALLFAVLSGTVVGVARVLVARKFAESQRREARVQAKKR